MLSQHFNMFFGNLQTVFTHLVAHIVWPYQPENPPGRPSLLGLSELVHEEAHPSFPYSS